MAERRYSISQASRLVGVENHVLRYWEDELHLEIPRDRKNQRYYTKLHIEMFQKINELKEKGYDIDTIPIFQIGATIGVHTGPYPLGIGVVKKSIRE